MTEYRSQKVKRKNSNLYRIPIATKGILNAYNNWLSTIPKPKKRICQKSQNTSLYEKCYKKITSKKNSRKILDDYVEKSRTVSKANVDVKPFSRKLWENVVENAFNYVNALKCISELLYPPNKCVKTDQESFLINFDWGSYLLYLFGLMTSAEAILRLLDNGEIVSHCQGYITGIVGLDKSDWYKLFSEIELVIEKARCIKELVVKSHGIPFDCILKSFPTTPKNLNWDLFMSESDCLNLSAKIVLDFLYSIFFVDDRCINADIDIRKTGSGICEEFCKKDEGFKSFETDINTETYEDESYELSSPEKPSTSTLYSVNSTTKLNAPNKQYPAMKSTQKNYTNYTNTQNISSVHMQPIFLNELQENRSEARVAWFRSKYNIIDIKRRNNDLKMAQNSLEYLTKLKLLPEESKNLVNSMLASNSAFSSESEKTTMRRFTPHMNVQNVRPKSPLSKAKCSYKDGGFTAVMPFHRYVSYFILNLDEPKKSKNMHTSRTRVKSSKSPRKSVNYKTKQSIQSTDSHGNIVYLPSVRKTSKKIDLKPVTEEYHEELYEIQSIIPEKSKIFENPVPERRSRPRNGLKKRQNSTMLKGPVKSAIFTQSNDARPSIPFSSLPRDHPLITTHSLKKGQSDTVSGSQIPIKKTTPSLDLKHIKKTKSRDRLVNYCMIDLNRKMIKQSNLMKGDNKNNEMEKTIVSYTILDNIEHFLNSGLRQNKLIRCMEEIHLPACHCQKLCLTTDPLIMILMDQYDKSENFARLKDYNILMLKMFIYLYPTAFITKESEINFSTDSGEDLKSHFISVSDEDASFSDKKVFSAILDMTEKRFMDEHRSAQKLASKLPSLV